MSNNNDDVKNLLKENNVNYLFLPPYSPEYNPIELAWSKVKQFIKKLSLEVNFIYGYQLTQLLNLYL